MRENHGIVRVEFRTGPEEIDVSVCVFCVCVSTYGRQRVHSGLRNVDKAANAAMLAASMRFPSLSRM